MRLSENFSESEFACKGRSCCGGTAAVSMELVSVLQAVRGYLGKPLRITSGFRCKVHNKAVGGAANSMHCRGWAADVVPPAGVSTQELAKCFEVALRAKEVSGGIIQYPGRNFVHVDVRRSKYRNTVR